jgi:hypothetical protein
VVVVEDGGVVVVVVVVVDADVTARKLSVSSAGAEVGVVTAGALGALVVVVVPAGDPRREGTPTRPPEGMAGAAPRRAGARP